MVFCVVGGYRRQVVSGLGVRWYESVIYRYETISNRYKIMGQIQWIHTCYILAHINWLPKLVRLAIISLRQLFLERINSSWG